MRVPPGRMEREGAGMGQDMRGGAKRLDTLHPERVAERTTSRGLY